MKKRTKELKKVDLVGEDAVEAETETADNVIEERTDAAAESAVSGQTEAAAELRELKAGLSGKVIPLDDVPDNVFSQHIMGDGIAIEPESDTVLAPADATVGVVMADTGHACGLVLPMRWNF